MLDQQVLTVPISNYFGLIVLVIAKLFSRIRASDSSVQGQIANSGKSTEAGAKERKLTPTR
jgi:hypothetical protein